MSENQLIQSVRNGRKIECDIFDDKPVEGYLAGMDDEYLFVLVPDAKQSGFSQRLVRRDCNPQMSLSSDSTYDDEPSREAMEKIIGPFRTAITRGSNRHPGGN